MENKRNSMLNTALVYGSLLALSNILLGIVYYLMNMQFDESQQYIGLVLSIVFIVLGILNHRNKNLNGYISYGNALGTGVMISLVAGIIGAVYFLVFSQYIDPEYMSKMMEHAETVYLEKGYSEEEVSRIIEGQRMMSSPLIMFFTTIIVSVLAGLIISLIVSIFLRKENPSFENKFGTE
jgi:hypothetical protein